MKSSFVGLSDNNVLVSFDSSNPSRVNSIPVTGIDGSLLGIDTRPANGLLYGITTANKIYTIDSNTGNATQISTLSTPFTATSISGFDFNPVADRLRLVGDNDQNFRINVDTGAVTVDGNLAFAAGDVNASSNPTLTAAAYTNAIAGATATRLYNIDTALDVLTLQNPPNDGTLTTVGALGIDLDDQAGFDIVSTSDGKNAAFAVSNSTLYSIDLSTGQATNSGTIALPAYSSKLQGLAAVDKPKIVDPIATNSRFLALSNANTLASFSPNNPQAVQSIAVTGLQSGETLLGIDTRPANGLVYGLTTASNLYTIDPSSGAASLVSTLDRPFTGTSITGFDFNPVVDRLRLVGDDDQNLRINVDTGAVTVDGNLAYAAGDANFGANPAVSAAAYINAIAGTTTTQLYDIDTNLDVLTLQNPPNNGTLTTVGALGTDFGKLSGFDIISTAEGTNAAFAVSNSNLYSINLQTGAASSLGAIGSGGNTYQGLATVANSIVAPTAPVKDKYPSVIWGDTYGDGMVELLPGDAAYANASNDTTYANFDNVLSTGDNFYDSVINPNFGDLTQADFFANSLNNQAATEIYDQTAYFGISSASSDGGSYLRSLSNNTFGFGEPGNLGISDNNSSDAGLQTNFKVV